MGIRFRLTQGKHYARADGRSVIVYLNGGIEKQESGYHKLVKGDILECDPDMLKHIMNRFEQIDPDPPAPEPTAGLCIVAVDNGMFDVVNSATGEALNDVLLTKDVALTIVSQFKADHNLETARIAAKAPPEQEDDKSKSDGDENDADEQTDEDDATQTEDDRTIEA